MKKNHWYTALPMLVLTLWFEPACNSNNKTEISADAVHTSVSIVNPSVQSITEYIDLNGVTIIQKKDNIRSNSTGFIAFLNHKPGDSIKKGQLFCTIGTKEQNALKNIASLDTSLLKFQQPISVLSNVTGNIISINVLQGDYVTEGDVLANVTEPTSLIVQVNVPYEFNKYVQIGKSCLVILPDGKTITTAMSGVMPSMDNNSQTQTYFIRVANQVLPENLNVIVRICQNQKNNLLCVQTSAIQTDELQKEFWVMKVVNTSMAVKIPVKIGLQNDSLTEIISDKISVNDQIIQEGAFSLPDSSLVTIKK